MNILLSSILIFVFLLIHDTDSANPIEEPIEIGGLDFHTRKIVQLPNENGGTAQIVCIVSFGRFIYICTATKIYQMSTSGRFREWFDVGAAVKKSTGRNVNLANAQHGGVRSIAFHPFFRFNNKFYISFMEDRPSKPDEFEYLSDVSSPIVADSVVAEFEFDSSEGAPDPMSYRQVLRVGMPVYDHPIKQMAFWGFFLYISHGDGSEQSASSGGGQNNDALGKILRIDPLEKNGRPYSIPFSNPFARTSSMLSEVYALGFRNPHHICFGRDGTLYAAETGRANIEEVNIVLRGANYGWSLREGTFVQAGGGLITGIKPLPDDDAKNGFEYPAAQWGHDGKVGAGFTGQAIAGGCPVENGSPLRGVYFYADFPVSGRLFYSKISDLKGASTRGDPDQLKQAPTKQAVIFYDDDNDPSTEPIEYKTLGDIVQSDPKAAGQNRADVRFGRGPFGEMYWSSKRTGSVYLATSSLPGGPGGLTSE